MSNIVDVSDSMKKLRWGGMACLYSHTTGDIKCKLDRVKNDFRACRKLQATTSYSFYIVWYGEMGRVLLHTIFYYFKQDLIIVWERAVP